MEQRLDQHEQWLERHDRRFDEAELDAGRTRDRVSQLESDRKLVSELAQTTLVLGKKAGESLEAIDAIAERAVDAVLDRRREARRREWKFWAGWLAALGSIAGLVFDRLHLHF